MKTSTLVCAGLAAVFVSVLPVMPAQASFKTFVSASGSDANNCSLSAPCASIGHAVSQTFTGGIVSCLDSNNYTDLVTITISLTIDCGGTTAAGGPFVVNGAGISVVIKNISIFDIGNPGIELRQGHVYVENVYMSDTLSGILVDPTAGTVRLFVSNCLIKKNYSSGSTGSGIFIAPSGSASVLAEIVGTRVEANNNGIWADTTAGTGTISVNIRDSVVAQNAYQGITANAGGGVASVTVDHSTSVQNGANGIFASGGKAIVILGNSTVMSNNTGLSATGGGLILSYQNNQLTGNVADGSPTGVLTVK